MAVYPFKEHEPTGRPLAEPPIFDYDSLVRKWTLGTDALKRHLFGKHIALGYQWRDQKTEQMLLVEYCGWASDISRARPDIATHDFFRISGDEISVDLDEFQSNDSPSKIIRPARDAGIVSALTLWEFYHLDENGGTTNI